MSSFAAQPNARKVSPAFLVMALVGVGILVAGFLYLNKPVVQEPDAPASQEAKAYLSHLALSDVAMQASENLVNQQVVEVQGNIANLGSRTLASIEVYCVFYGVDGKVVHRERSFVVGGAGSRNPLKPGETKAFRLPFDSLPDGWNRAMPQLVVAQIKFVS